MIFHPVVNDVTKRYAALDEAVQKGRIDLSQAISSYAYVCKDNTLGMGQLDSSRLKEATDLLGNGKPKYIPFVVSRYTEDRDGDVVVPMGVQLDNYALNPVVCFGHQETPFPIGTSRREDGAVAVYPEENLIRAWWYPDYPDPDSDFIAGKVIRGVLSASSIAFVPIKAMKRDDIQKARTHSQPMTPPGWQFEIYDLTEWSIVTVPSNAGAIRDSLDSEKSFISPRLQKALKPYAAKAQGRCFSGWCQGPNCPIPAEEPAVAPKKQAPKTKPAAKATPPAKVKAVPKIAAKPIAKPCCDACSKGKACRCKGVKKGFQQDVAAELEKRGIDIDTYRFTTQGALYLQQSEGKLSPSRCADAIVQNKDKYLTKSLKKKDGNFTGGTQADTEGAGVPGRNPNPPGDAKQKAPLTADQTPKPPYTASALNDWLTKGGIIIISTMTKATQYSSKNAGWFSDGSDGLYVQAGSKKNFLGQGGKLVGWRFGPGTSKSIRKLFEEGDALSLLRPVQTQDGNLKAANATGVVQSVLPGDQLLVKFIDGSTAVIPETFGIVSGKADLLSKGGRDRGKVSGRDNLTTHSVSKALVPPSQVKPGDKTWKGTVKNVQEVRESGDLNGYYIFYTDGTKEFVLPNDKVKIKALGESSGMIGGYAVAPKPIQANDAPADKLDETRTEGWAACDTCHGDGNCNACGGTGDQIIAAGAGKKDCNVCGGSGECTACGGQGHVQKGIKKQNAAGHQAPGIAPQANVKGNAPTVPQVLAALYSHAKAEAAYLDQLDDEHKDTLSEYRGQHLDERMDLLKNLFSKAAVDEDLDKMCKAFEDGYDRQNVTPDKGFTQDASSSGVDGPTATGEAQLINQGDTTSEDDTVPKAKEKHWIVHTRGSGYQILQGAGTDGGTWKVKWNDNTYEGPFHSLDEVKQHIGASGFEVKGIKTMPKKMKENTVPADGGYVEGDADAAGELNAGAAPFNKSADRDTVSEGDAPFNKAAPDDLDITKDGTGTGDAVDEGPTVYNKDGDDDVVDKDGTGTGDAVDEGPAVYNKDLGGPCVCGADAPPGANFCPGCGAQMDQGAKDFPQDVATDIDPTIPVQADDADAPIVQADDTDMPVVQADDDTAPVVQAGMDDLVPGGDTTTPLKADDAPPDFAAQNVDDKNGSTDPNVDEILERYRNPKSNSYAVRKWLVPKKLLPFIKYRVATNGKKYLVKADTPDDVDKDAVTPAQGEQVIGSGTVKDITNRLAKICDDVKALYSSKSMKEVPEIRLALKNVYDQAWYVGKALTDAGKLQRNGGSGSVLSDKGKFQHNAGTDGDKGGSELFGGGNGSLQNTGSQQGKSPAKQAKRWEDQPADPAVAAKFAEVFQFCTREGILNGAAK